MPSHYSTGTSRRNSPPWCKKGMFTGINPTIDGRPAVLNAFVNWTGDYYGEPFAVITTVHLRRTPLNDGWTGDSAATGKRVHVAVADLATDEAVDVQARLYNDDVQFDAVTWYTVTTRFARPWGTPIFRKLAPPEHNPVILQILG